MAKTKQEPVITAPVLRPASTPEAVENQCIAGAYALAAQRIADGTASNTLLVHFLKLGSEKEQLERRVLEKQVDLIEAKTINLQSSQRIEELYSNAMEAMKRYSGNNG